MFRLEVFFVVLLVGLLMSEIVEKLARLLFHMYLLDHDPGLQFFFISLFFVLILVCLYCLYYLNPGLQYAEPIKYIQREFNIFRKKVKILQLIKCESVAVNAS